MPYVKVMYGILICTTRVANIMLNFNVKYITHNTTKMVGVKFFFFPVIFHFGCRFFIANIPFQMEVNYREYKTL